MHSPLGRNDQFFTQYPFNLHTGESLAKVSVLVRQAHHERNNQNTVHPELVEGCFWSFARGSG